MVFDEAFISSLPEPNHYYNPHVVALCKFPHLGKLLEQVETWFLNVPVSVQADIKARLRSQDDGQHLGAFYELMLHQYCLEEDWKTELHHVLDDGLTPDIKATTGCGQEFLLEVYTQQDEAAHRKVQIITNKLNDAITRLTTPFILSVHYQAHPPAEVDISKVAQDVQGWLDTLDPASKDEFQHSLNHLGLGIRVDARMETGLKIAGSGCVYFISGPTQTGLPGVGKVSNKLKAKRKKYASSKTDLPLVVAVCDGTSQSWWGEDTVDRALFGHPIITFAIDGSDDEPQGGRDNTGLVTPKPTKDGYFAVNKGISAVLYCSRTQEERGKIQYKMLLFHNPWTYVPLPQDIFTKIPQLVVTKNDAAGLTMEWDKQDHEKQRIYFI